MFKDKNRNEISEAKMMATIDQEENRRGALEVIVATVRTAVRRSKEKIHPEGFGFETNNPKPN